MMFDNTHRDMAPHPAELHRLHSALQSSQSAEHRHPRADSRSYEFPPPIRSAQPLWQGLSNERPFQHHFSAPMYAQSLFPPTLQTFSRRDEILAELHRVTSALETLAQGARACRIAIPPQLLCRLAAAFRQLEVTPTAHFVQQPYQPNFTQQPPQTPEFAQRNTYAPLPAIRGNYQQRYRPYHRFNRPESRASDVRQSEGQLRPRVDFALMQRTEVEDEYGRKRRLLKQSNTPSNRFERADAESDSNNDTRENSPTPARNDNKQDTDEQAKATLEKHEPEKSIIVRNLAPGTTADDVEAGDTLSKAMPHANIRG